MSVSGNSRLSRFIDVVVQASVAQLVELFTCNENVVCSSHTGGSNLYRCYMTFYDIHAHCFSNEHVPDKFLGVKLSLTDRLLLKLSGWVDWFSGDRLDNITSFMELMAMEPAEKLRILFGYYPKDTVICINLMDMRAIKGNIDIPYTEQIREMRALQDSEEFKGRIKLFLHMDMKYFDYEFVNFYLPPHFAGVKLYPPLSGNPANDWKLMQIFESCERYRIPITTHCGPFGVSSGSFWRMWNGKNADPRYWTEILKIYPKLKVNFAHFGEGDINWQATIIKFMEKYENVYTDTSFSCGVPLFNLELDRLMDAFPILKDRVLYGSDFYMVNLFQPDIGASLADLKESIGEANFKKITEVNPLKFLDRD